MPTMNPTTADPLAQLRDIHLPNTVDIWPIAPGWWLLALVICITVWCSYWSVRRYRRRRAYRRSALLTLKHLLVSCDDDLAYLQSVNRLLKQIAVTINPREDVSRLSGEQWLSYLDQNRKDKPFTEGVGQILANGPYQPATEALDRQQLQSLVMRWIKEQKPC